MKRLYALFAGLFVMALAVGSAFGFAPVDLTADLQLCTEWFEGFTGHADGMVLATAAAGALPEQVKQVLDEIKGEIKGSWEELKGKVAALENRPDVGKAEVKEEIEKVVTRIDDLETKMQRVATTQNEPEPGQLPKEAKAHIDHFRSFVKTENGQPEGYKFNGEKVYVPEPVIAVKDGRNVIEGWEYKALSVDSNPDGGFMVSPTMAQTIITRLFDTSPMRQYASIQTISGDAWEEPVDDDEATIGWVGERATRSETATPELDKLRIPLNEIYAKPHATQKLIDMWANAETWLAGKVSDKFGREEATQFVTGNGSNKPKGFVSYVSTTESWNTVKSVNSGDADEITVQGLIDLKADLQAAYLRNANFFMNRTSRKTIRSFRTDAVTASDGAGTFLWEPGLRAGDPDLLLGHPIVIFEDMADEAANAYPVAFGDMREAYLIIDHTTGIRVLRDPYSSKPYVEFYTTKRVGGGLRQGRALRMLKCST